MRATRAWLAVLVLVGTFLVVSAIPGFITYDEVKGRAFNVTYDKRSLRINGQPSLFLSGSIHPPRGTTDVWDVVFAEAKANGLNMVEVYIFWNFHEPVEGQINWSGDRNLRQFLQYCANNDLFVNLRVGPYVCAEWEYGGIPVWLGQKTGIEFRTNNPIWMNYMQKWFETVIDQLSDFFPIHGGPIVLVQVENELNGAPDAYVEWAGKMANEAVKSLGAPPIIMCNGQSAKNTINTCNGNDCSGFLEQHGQSGQILVTQPGLWTENEGGFQIWGNSPSHTTNYFWGRSSQDLAVAILKWFARGGSHMNYYMYFGGSNYGPWSGSSITTYYAVDGIVCPDTLPHEPKYSHVGQLHKIIASYAAAIVNHPAQLNLQVNLPWYNPQTHQWENGTQQYAYIYGIHSSKGVVFIENDADITITTRYNNRNYTLPEYSISIVDMDGTEVYNSGTISPPTIHRQDAPLLKNPLHWKTWSEPLSFAAQEEFPQISANHPLEQNNITKPELWSVYVYYKRNVTFNAQVSTLTLVAEKASIYTLYINGQPNSQVVDTSHWYASGQTTFSMYPAHFRTSGQHELMILSESLGNDNQMGSGSTAKHKGITGAVKIGGADYTSGPWQMQVGLGGENLRLFTQQGSSKVKWNDNWRHGYGKPAWFQTSFVVGALGKGEVVLLNATRGVTRGRAWINGHDLGRYWAVQMNDNSGRDTQALYHVPKRWMNLDGVTENLLTLVEVVSATELEQVSLVVRKMVPGQGNYKPTGYNVIDSCPMF